MEIRKTLAVAAAAVLVFQTNHPPIVKIEAPANNAVLDINTPITWQVHIADPEDGDSRYDEINTKEVLLEVARLKPGTKVPFTNSDPALNIMAANNCFNCHQFNAKSLGPSFFDIAKRYPATAASTDTLIRRIKDGSSGIWPGTEKMPSHPDLSLTAIRSTVHWILQSAARPDRAWYFGTTGLLHFNQPGTYTLTATYTDHGTKDQPTIRLTGTDRIVVSVK
jgi:cytochrome c